jgi:hypothetical protein
LGIDLFKSVLMYSNGAICLIKLLFKMGIFTVYCQGHQTLLKVQICLGAFLILCVVRKFIHRAVCMSQYRMENKVFYFYLFIIRQKSFIVVSEYAQCI